jgi:nitrate/nitrite transport system substrate-binding protein
MKRRQFLQYSTLSAAGFTIAACTSKGSTHFTQPAINFGKLERSDLQIGIVSSLDSLPLVVAKEKGMFKKYGLNVTLVKQTNWEQAQTELHAGKLDATQSLFAMPLWEYFGGKGGKSKAENNEDKNESRRDRDRDKDKATTSANAVALMGINLNGNSISFGETAWKGGLRARHLYNATHEMRDSYNRFFRDLKQPPTFAISHPAAMANYTARYWLGTMGIDAERDLKFQVMADSNIQAGLESGKVIGYATDELFNQQMLADKKAFTGTLDRDIWQGHPEKIIAALDTWVKANPNTSQALMAAVLEACQYCEQADNLATISPLLAKSEYANVGNNKNWQKILAGSYNFGGLEGNPQTLTAPDFQIWHFQGTKYLQQPNHANFLWHSHAVWVLTQMIRWRQNNLTDYPKDADNIIKQLYPTEPYSKVAKAFWLNLPKGQLKVEQAEIFVDRIAFDPNKPREYLNNFELRA